MFSCIRTEWTEGSEFYIADRKEDGSWTVAARDSWEVKWHNLRSSLALTQKVERHLREQLESQQNSEVAHVA